jgi:hypothetical protein
MLISLITFNEIPGIDCPYNWRKEGVLNKDVALVVNKSTIANDVLQENYINNI